MKHRIVKSFTSKPIQIEAAQYTSLESYQAMLADWPDFKGFMRLGKIHIFTLEGIMRADVGDWIIKGIMGEFYPVKPDVFRVKYFDDEER